MSGPLAAAPAAPTSFRRAMYELLVKVFTVHEFVMFLGELPGGSAILTMLPDLYTTPPSRGKYVWDALDKLLREGRIDANFFLALQRCRPIYAAEIVRLEQMDRRQGLAEEPGKQRAIHANDVLALVSWIHARTEHRRRVGGLIGVNVACLMLWCVGQAASLSLTSILLFAVLGFLLGHRFPALGANLQLLKGLEGLCMALCALEAAQAPVEQKQALVMQLVSKLQTGNGLKIYAHYPVGLDSARAEQSVKALSEPGVLAIEE